eukprot:1144290-Pelagomonas_calceolata.AAC.4
MAVVAASSTLPCLSWCLASTVAAVVAVLTSLMQGSPPFHVFPLIYVALGAYAEDWRAVYLSSLGTHIFHVKIAPLRTRKQKTRQCRPKRLRALRDGPLTCKLARVSSEVGCVAMQCRGAIRGRWAATRCRQGKSECVCVCALPLSSTGRKGQEEENNKIENKSGRHHKPLGDCWLTHLAASFAQPPTEHDDILDCRRSRWDNQRQRKRGRGELQYVWPILDCNFLLILFHHNVQQRVLMASSCIRRQYSDVTTSYVSTEALRSIKASVAT